LIIACPECTGPFELADGNIAPLVQIECPTCNFRMILDFEAANDTSLREDGMALAQGFRDAGSYRQAVGAGQVVYAPPGGPRPELRAVPAQPAAQPVAQPVEQPIAKPTVVQQPKPVQPTLERPPVRQPQVEPPAERPPVRQPVAQPVQPVIEQPVAAQPIVEQPPLDKPPVRLTPSATPQPDRPRSRPTLIAHTPPPPQPVVAQPVVQSQPVELEAPVDVDVELDVDEPEVEIDSPPVAEARPEPARPEPPRPELELPSKPQALEPDDVVEPDKPKRSAARMVFTTLLLVILAAIFVAMAWSLATTGHPYQKILDVTGLEIPGLTPANKAGDKADGKADEKADKSDEQADG
jgi:hypothetical protein